MVLSGGGEIGGWGDVEGGGMLGVGEVGGCWGAGEIGGIGGGGVEGDAGWIYLVLYGYKALMSVCEGEGRIGREGDREGGGG